MKTNVVFCIAFILVVVASSCQTSEKEETRKRLEGKWRFLGNWKGTELQQDTLKVGLKEAPFSLDASSQETSHNPVQDTFTYEVVTNSRIWNVTTVDDAKVIAAKPHPYFASMNISSDSGWFMIHDFTDTMKVKLEDKQTKFYSKAVIDEYTLDTLVNASTGTLALITDDTMHILWDSGFISKFKKENTFP